MQLPSPWEKYHCPTSQCEQLLPRLQPCLKAISGQAVVSPRSMTSVQESCFTRTEVGELGSFVCLCFTGRRHVKTSPDEGNSFSPLR